MSEETMMTMDDAIDAQKLVIIDLDELEFDDKNANQGTERGSKMVQESVEKHGAGRGVLVDKNRTVVAGEKTVRAMKAAGIRKALLVPNSGNFLLVTQREDFDLSDEDPNSKARSYAYYDNRTGQVSLDWDPKQLLDDKEAGFDFSGLWDSDAFQRLTAHLQSDTDGLGESGEYDSVYQVLIECRSEAEQLKLIHALQEEGHTCTALIA